MLLASHDIFTLKFLGERCYGIHL